MTRSLVVCLMLATLAARPARGDSRSFDIEHLQLATQGGDFLATEGAGHLQPWDWRVGLAYRYADAPLVIDQGKQSTLLVAGRSLLELNGGVELGKWLGVGASLPMAIDSGNGMLGNGAALGDLRLVPRVEIFRGQHLSLAGLAGLRLPTGDTTRFLGEGMVVFEPRVAVQAVFGMLRLGANLGVRIREARQYLDLTVGNEVFGSLAAAVVPKPWLDVFAELHSDTAMSSAFGKGQSSPVEALLGLAGSYRDFRLGAAVGLGLVRGFGDPRVRAVATLEYRRPPRPKPVMPVIVAQRPAPPPPDPAPAPPPPAVEEDEDDDELAEEPAVSEEPDVSFGGGRIELAKPIFFDTNRKRIHSRFRDELFQLARAIKRRPDLQRVWIEGHADSTGPERWNLELSRLRAREVAKFLEAAGVGSSRLMPVGYGEAKPLVPTPRGEPNERNRRVHFYTDGSVTPVKPPPPKPVAKRGESE